MARLGLKLEEELAQLDPSKGLDWGLAQRWAAEESVRERRLWRHPRGAATVADEQQPAADAQELEFEDIEDFLFSVGTLQASFPSCRWEELVHIAAHR
jgi:hypothetical protein